MSLSTGRDTMKKRILWWCGILVLGLFTTVAVAWACAAWINPGHATDQFIVAPIGDGLSEVVAAQVRFGHTRINRCVAVAELDERGELRAMKPVRERNERSETLAGWPLRALACTNPADVRFMIPGRFGHMWSNPRMSLAHGISLSQFPPVMVWPHWRALPYQPLWTGLIVNTLFYSLAWTGLLLGPGMLRRGLRRRRGLCERCGYDLRNVAHTHCPECGHPVAQRATAAQQA